VAKRKPPSRRPERKLDEAALAIARSREGAKGEKPDGPQRPDGAQPALDRLAKSIASRKVISPHAFPSTKRPKKV
jgi:hypothetical protein